MHHHPVHTIVLACYVSHWHCCCLAADQPLEFVLSASIGSLLVVSLAALRIYLGWSYVGERLLSAAVPYEETGWWAAHATVADAA